MERDGLLTSIGRRETSCEMAFCGPFHPPDEMQAVETALEPPGGGRAHSHTTPLHAPDHTRGGFLRVSVSWAAALETLKVPVNGVVADIAEAVLTPPDVPAGVSHCARQNRIVIFEVE